MYYNAQTECILSQFARMQAHIVQWYHMLEHTRDKGVGGGLIRTLSLITWHI